MLTRAASLGIVPHGILSDPPSETDRNAVAGSLEAVRRTPSRRENEHALSRFPFRPPRIYSRRPRTSAHPPAPTLDVRSQILEQSAYLQQYHAAMAPFLGIQHPPVQSPRGNAEEEIALQALQHMKNVPPSSLAGNSNAAPGAVGTRTPQRTSATRGEGARARVPATRYRLARTRGVATRDETRAVPLASRTRASPRTHRAKAIPVFFFFSGRTRDSNRRTRRRSRAEVDRVDSGPSRKTVASFFAHPSRSLPIAPDARDARIPTRISPQTTPGAQSVCPTPLRRFPTTRTSRSRRSPAVARPRAPTSSATSSGSTRRRRSARAAASSPAPGARRRRRRQSAHFGGGADA